MTECLKKAKLIGNAVGSLGGPRADGTKVLLVEKLYKYRHIYLAGAGYVCASAVDLPFKGAIHFQPFSPLTCTGGMFSVPQEKSLGGLCRRFVQLFLVGNEVVSVGEAAEKLSDAADVSAVYQRRVIRRYHANR